MSQARKMIEARDFTYVSALYRDPVPRSERHPEGWAHRAENFVVLTPFKSEAKAPAMLYCDDRWGTPHELHFYPRNYAAEARALRAAGKVIDCLGRVAS